MSDSSTNHPRCYTSPNAFERISTIIRALANLLRPGADRFAFVGFPEHYPPYTRNVFTSECLQPFEMKAIWDAITILPKSVSNAQPLASDYQRCVEHSEYLLLQPGNWQSHISDSFSKNEKHIMIVSASTGLGRSKFSINPAQIHSINPSSAPMIGEKPFIQGWHIESGLTTLTAFNENSSIVDFFYNRCKTAITSMRQNHHPGLIRNINFTFKPFKHSRVEMLQGPIHTECLRPGEVIQVLALTTVEPCGTKPRRTCSSSSGRNSTEIYRDLDAMLGKLSTPVMTVQANYMHSIFPPTTSLNTQKTVSLHRYNAACDWNSIDPQDKLALKEEDKRETRKRLAYSIAASLAPREALEAIREFLADCEAPDAYLKELFKELKYRADYSERLSTSTSSSINPARQIWRNLRTLRSSSAVEPLIRNPRSPFKLAEAELQTLVLRALKNRRSVDEASLRSFLTPTMVSVPVSPFL
jgi:hypothetical protein